MSWYLVGLVGHASSTTLWEVGPRDRQAYSCFLMGHATNPVELRRMRADWKIFAGMMESPQSCRHQVRSYANTRRLDRDCHARGVGYVWTGTRHANGQTELEFWLHLTQRGHIQDRKLGRISICTNGSSLIRGSAYL